MATFEYKLSRGTGYTNKVELTVALEEALLEEDYKKLLAAASTLNILANKYIKAKKETK